MLEAYRGKDIMVREFFDVLNELGKRVACPIREEDLRDNPKLYGALDGLGWHSYAAPMLVEALREDNDTVRGAAAEVLGRIGARTAVPHLIEALRDEGLGVAASAAMALGRLGGDEATRALMTFLQGQRSRIIMTNHKGTFVFRTPAGHAASEALKEIGTPEALAAVTAWEDES